MARSSGDEDVRTSRVGAGDATYRSASNGGRKHRAVALEPTATDGRTETGIAALSNLLMRDDGWLRAIPDGEGKTTYLKWKFTRGRFSGCYVMVVIRPWDWCDGFRMLETKILNCYDGLRKPTRDKSYLPIFDDEQLPE